MAKGELICVRDDSDLIERIDERMKAEGFPGKMSDWIRDAILDRLSPTRKATEIKRDIKHLLDTDPEFRDYFESLFSKN